MSYSKYFIPTLKGQNRSPPMIVLRQNHPPLGPFIGHHYCFKSDPFTINKLLISPPNPQNQTRKFTTSNIRWTCNNDPGNLVVKSQPSIRSTWALQRWPSMKKGVGCVSWYILIFLKVPNRNRGGFCLILINWSKCFDHHLDSRSSGLMSPSHELMISTKWLDAFFCRIWHPTRVV